MRRAIACCLCSWILLPFLYSAPALHFMDDKGSELLVLEEGEIPYASLRAVTPMETLLISGDLEEKDGKLQFTMAAGTGDPADAGWIVNAGLDRDKTRANVELKTFGKTNTGLPLALPPVNGIYVRVDVEERLRRARDENARAQEALVSARERVKKATSPGLQEILKNQAIWEDERLESARLVAESVDDLSAEEDVPEYWQTRAELTRLRTQLLLAASGLDAPAGHGGRYVDAEGGAIELVLAPGDPPESLGFHLTVVRSQAAHTGEISGIARFSQPGLAVFVDQDPDAFTDGKPATLRFRFKGHELSVEAENTLYYHGARAYFNGTYYHVPE